MALKDLVVQRRSFKVGEASIDLRGLSMSDIASLLETHKEAMQAFFGADDDKKLAAVGTFSGAAASIISLAADEPDAVESVSLIALGTQLKMLKAIWDMTDISSDDLGNILSGTLEGFRKINEVVGKHPALTNG